MINSTKSRKEFHFLKDIYQKYYCLNYYYIRFNKYGVKCSTSPRFRENEGWVNSIDPYDWFQWYFRYWLGRRFVDDKRQIYRWKEIISKFKDKLDKMIRYANGTFDDYFSSPKIRQILLHWDYELVENNVLSFCFYLFVNIKMSYCWFNRQELLQKANKKYHNCRDKEKAAEYYIKNKDANNKYKNLSEEKKTNFAKYKNGLMLV